ncbi:hypothetical protein L0V05_06855 [Tabrizicola sp. J26]|uniref:hypothetical protein n=1 Tax=Alitabrizicola rongguiensis TaxID=2909234 RepID=UPI001F423323|nr:hypothetical protein [Tabrizicola rongguiensis]MCF1708533.1 hypothetical protein [Tabrizicola rongguiensis]
MLRLLVLALISLPALALAESPMTGAEFEAQLTGKTMTYAEAGQVYGIEQYLPGRQVVWAFSGEECRKGTWYEQGPAICFIYEDNPDPQCWLFFQRADGLKAHFIGDPEGTELSAVDESTQPLSCAGPDLGV